MKLIKLLLPFTIAILIQSCSIAEPEYKADEPTVEFSSLDTLESLTSSIISGRYVSFEGDSFWVANQKQEIIDSASSHNYIVICPDSLINFSQKLVAYREQNSSDAIEKGCIISLDHLRESFTPDELNLKEFFSQLARKMDTTQLTYVVFIGQPHPFEGIPLPVENGDFAYIEDMQNAVTGRIPVESNNEGYQYLNKLIDFEQDLSKEAVLIADDQWSLQRISHYNFSSSILRRDTILSNLGWNTNVILAESFATDTIVDEYFSVHKSFLTTNQCTEVTNTIVEEWNNTNGFIFYNGHSSSNVWSDEKLFTVNEIARLHSNNILCIPSTAYNMNTGERSLSEELLIARYGIVAFIGSSHTMPYESENARFMDTLCQIASQSKTLGDLFYSVNITSNLQKRYTIMGDPALSLRGISK